MPPGFFVKKLEKSYCSAYYKKRRRSRPSGKGAVLAALGHSVRRKKANRRSLILVALVAVVLVVFLSVGIISLQRENARLAESRDALKENVEAELEKNEELKENKDAPLSDEEIEDIARDRFGLAYPDEIILVPEE